MTVEVTADNFEKLKNGNLPLVVDLWATWCGPCRMVGPIMEELSNEYEGKIVVGKCDIEANEDIPMQYGVRNIPTILFFKNGQLVDKFVGAAARISSRRSLTSCCKALVKNTSKGRKNTESVTKGFLCSFFLSFFFGDASCYDAMLSRKSRRRLVTLTLDTPLSKSKETRFSCGYIFFSFFSIPFETTWLAMHPKG